MAPIEGRRLYVATGSIGILDYGRDVHEPMIYHWNDAPEAPTASHTIV